MSLALIDGDYIAFRAAAGAAQVFFEGDEPTGNPDGAADAAAQIVESWRNIANCRDVMVVFSGMANYRKVVLPSYKAHRTKGKPPGYWHTVESVSDRFPTLTINGLEGDDLLGILATTDKYADRAVILSPDKDMRTIPTRVMNPLKDSRARLVSEAEANHWWLMQTLMGDPTDGYTGIPKVGPKKAAVILGGATPPRTQVELGVLWGKVVGAYRSAGLTEQDALTQARCARILRREDYDKATKEIRLWHPNNPELLPLATVCGASMARTPA